MEFVFWSKDLHILRTVRCKIFDGPRSQNGVLILKKQMDENVIQFTEWDGNTCNIIADHINISQNLQKLFILYKMDDFNFIHCTQPVQEMHYHSSHQYLTKPSKLVYSS